MAPLNFGALAIYLHAARGEPFEIGDLFAAFRGAYATVLAAHVLFVVLVGAGFTLLVLPGIWIATRLSFVAFLVMDEGETASGAVRESWRRTEGHAWRILRLWIVGAVLGGVGLLLLGVGVVPAAMWAHVAFAALFVRITAADRESERAIVHSLA
jgi:membrane-anchored glycerophosphoryl diester phosphodiesterase (GDPDase)